MTTILNGGMYPAMRGTGRLFREVLYDNERNWGATVVRRGKRGPILYAHPLTYQNVFFTVDARGEFHYSERMRDLPEAVKGRPHYCLQKGHEVEWDQGRRTFEVREVNPLVVPKIDYAMSLDDALFRLKDALLSALERRLAYSERPCITFSGGVDSFVNGALLWNVLQRKDLHFYTYWHADGNQSDFQWAMRHLDLLGVPPEQRHVVDMGQEDMEQLAAEGATRYEFTEPYTRFVGKPAELAFKRQALARGHDVHFNACGADQWHYQKQLEDRTSSAYRYVRARLPYLDPESDEFSGTVHRAMFERFIQLFDGWYTVPDINSNAKMLRPDMDTFSAFISREVIDFYSTLPRAVRYVSGEALPGCTPATKKIVIRMLMRHLHPDSGWGARKMYAESWASHARGDNPNNQKDGKVPPYFQRPFLRRYTTGRPLMAEADGVFLE